MSGAPPPEPPLAVLQCATCRSVVSDTMDYFVASDGTCMTITVSDARFILVDGAHVTSHAGWDAACVYQRMNCTPCGAELGRVYSHTTAALAHLQDNYTFSTPALISYELGSIEQASKAAARALEELAARHEDDLRAPPPRPAPGPARLGQPPRPAMDPEKHARPAAPAATENGAAAPMHVDPAAHPLAAAKQQQHHHLLAPAAAPAPLAGAPPGAPATAAAAEAPEAPAAAARVPTTDAVADADADADAAAAAADAAPPAAAAGSPAALREFAVLDDHVTKLTTKFNVETERLVVMSEALGRLTEAMEQRRLKEDEFNTTLDTVQNWLIRSEERLVKVEERTVKVEERLPTVEAHAASRETLHTRFDALDRVLAAAAAAAAASGSTSLLPPADPRPPPDGRAAEPARQGPAAVVAAPAAAPADYDLYSASDSRLPPSASGGVVGGVGGGRVEKSKARGRGRGRGGVREIARVSSDGTELPKGRGKG